MFPLTIVAHKIFPTRFWYCEMIVCMLRHSDSLHLLRMAFGFACKVCFRIFAAFLNITRHIEGVSRSLRNGKPEVQRNAAGDGTETDDDAPHLVDRKSTVANTRCLGLAEEQRLLEANGDN